MKTANPLGPSILSLLAAVAAFGAASTARADTYSCLDANQGCCIQQDGSYPMMCAEDFDKQDKSCGNVCDVSGWCMGGCFTSYNSKSSWASFASAYDCVIPAPTATNVSLGLAISVIPNTPNELLAQATVSNGHNATDKSVYSFWAMSPSLGLTMISSSETTMVNPTTYVGEGYEYYLACVEPIVSGYNGGNAETVTATGTTVCTGWQTIDGNSMETASSGNLSMDGACYSTGSMLMWNASQYLTFQSDGNLVLYRVDGSSTKAEWATGTNGKNAKSVCLQGDGNMVVYSSSGSALWASGTNGKGVTSLNLQSDCNLVLYTSSGSPKWATGTNPC